MFVYGAGGHAKVVCDALRARGVAVSGFYDDKKDRAEFCGIPVLREVCGGEWFVAIGDNAARKKVAEMLARRGDVAFPQVVHPAAVISPDAEIGAGTTVFAGAVVNAGTRAGNFCIINTGASVDHDCRLGACVHVAPHATLCGGVSVGAGTWIGAGAVVTKDVPDNTLAFGNPCRARGLINTPPQFTDLVFARRGNARERRAA